MGKAVGKVLKVVAVVASIAAAVPTFGASLGLSAALLTGISVAAALGSSLLAPKPKTPQVSSASADRLFANIDARTPRKIVFGRTAMATDVRDQEYTGGQDYLHRFVVVASHKVKAINEIWFDDKRVWTLSGGVEGDAVGYLTVTSVLEGSAANAINISSRMGSTRRYTGCAYVHLRYKLTGNTKKAESPFSQSIPSRVTIRGDGAYVYDPRKDSTAGGSGSHRANDQSTWEWSDTGSRNPALQQLWYELGWRINGKLAVGKGVPPARLDLASYITAANACDESVALAGGGTEPRYRSDGVFSEGDDPGLVRDNFKAAMNAVLDDLDGKIRLTVLVNDLATPIAAFTADDILDGVRWEQTPPLQDTFNVIRGGFTDPSDKSLYQLVDYPEVALTSVDGIERIETVNYPLVQSPSQAQRLSKQRLQRMQYPGLFTANFQATAWKVQKGDIVTLTFPALGWVNKLFRVIDITVRVDGVVPMVLREEHASIYAWSANEAAPVTAAAPTTYNTGLNPLRQGITEVDVAAAAAQSAANLAAIDATSALGKIVIIQSDGYLSAGEKPDIIRQWGDIVAELSGIQAQAAAVGVSATVFTSAYTALGTYLGGLSPAWNNTGLDTAIVPATFNGKFGDYYYARTAILNAIAAEAALRAAWGGVTGSGKPEDNATKGDNLVRNAAFENGSTGYTVSGSAAIVASSALYSPPYAAPFLILFNGNSTPGDCYANGGATVAVSGDALYASMLVGAGAAGTSFALGVNCYSATGGSLGAVSTPFTTTAAMTSAPQLVSGKLQLPVGTASVQIWVSCAANTAGVWGFVWRVAPSQLAADITKNNQVVVEVSPNQINVPAATDGTVATALFPIQFTPKVTKGGADIRKAAGTSYAVDITGATGNVENTAGADAKGTTSITALSANTAKAVLTVIVDGIAQPAITVTIKKDIPPPTSTSTGAGGAVKERTDSDFTALSSTTYVAITDPMTVDLASGERLVGTASLDYNIAEALNGARYASAKWRYVAGTGTPTNDFGAAINGSNATPSRYNPAGDYVEGSPGHGDFNQDVTGLSAGQYTVQLFAAISAGSRTLIFSGTAKIEAKP